MANDFDVNEFKLKDPVRSIPDGLQDPVKDKTPGFFQSLRNPLDLMLEESLPASLYQWMTGNTKKKQAQEALDYLRNNPQDKGSKIYQEAERKLQRFGYLLDDGPMSIDMKEVGNFIKSNPKMFGAELVNMLMADPWLLLTPLGFGRLGRGVVNSIKLKSRAKFKYKTTVAKKFPGQLAIAKQDVKVGAAATLLTPLVFSSTWQLGEDATIDPKRTTIETTIGASAGAVLSIGFQGTGALISKMSGIAKAQVAASQIKTYNSPKYKNTPEKLVETNEEGIYRGVDDILNDLETTTKEFTPQRFQGIKAEVTSALRTVNETGKDLAWNTALKRAGTFAAIGGTAQFLTADDEKLLATAKGAAVGAGIYGGWRLFSKAFRTARPEFDEAALQVEGGLEAMKIAQIKLNSAGYELANTIKRLIPDAIDSRRKIFYYITRARVDPNTGLPPPRYNPKFKPLSPNQLTVAELEAANAIEKSFNRFAEIFGKGDDKLFNNIRTNYLPLIWAQYNPAHQPFQFISRFDRQVTGPSGKFAFGKRGVFGDINQGLQKNYNIKPGYDDPVELIKIYAHAAGKALATRALITNLERTKVNNRALLTRLRFDDDPNYVKFKHPYFKDAKLGDPWIHQGMEKSLRMIFDATDEHQLTSAIFTINLMMKRLAVGFSFFHAGALVESMFFAGNKLRFTGKVLNPRSSKELQSYIDNPAKYRAEFPHAAEVLGRQELGFNDLLQFARGTGLQISTPEDVGFDRFYYNLSAGKQLTIDKFFKRHLGISPTEKVEKVFRGFDKVTWDRVFTQAKLHTYLTQLNKTLDPKVDKTLSQVYAKARRAAQFANDAFGGQDWARVANSIQAPWLKNLTQTTFAPGSRGYMQLLMFAPDWTISNIRIIAKSLPGFEADEAARRLYQYYFLRAAVTYAAAGTALNYAFSGKSLLENTDPTRIDLGNGEVLTFSKQLMEPFHWITAPQSTALKKIGSLPRTTIEVLTNKKYLTTKWSPNITKKDDEAIEKGLKIGGQIGKRFLPIWLQQASQNISEGLQRDGLSADLAWDTAVDFTLGQLGHPRYQGPRYTQYKTKGVVRSPYETLF